MTQALVPFISCRAVSVAYDGNVVLSNVSASFCAGSLTAIIGPNGSGKSTLIKAIIGELSLKSGEISYNGISPRNFAYLPQVNEINRHFPISMWDMVSLGAWSSTGSFRGISIPMLEKQQRAIDEVGLNGFESRQISQLSAGQFQRALFARLILQDSQVVIIDEPFNGIDAKTTSDLLSLLANWQHEGRAVIAVLHDSEQVKAHFSHAILLMNRLIAAGPTVDVVTQDNLQLVRNMANSNL